MSCLWNSTKCKICGDVIFKDKKKEHLKQAWDPWWIKYFIENDQAEDLLLVYEHGADVNSILDKTT